MELVNWDEIDAMPAAEQDERVVRLAFPSSSATKAGERNIVPNKWYLLCFDEHDVGAKLGYFDDTVDVYRAARQYPTVATFEAQSRAEWAAHKAAQVGNATWMEICARCGKMRGSHREGMCYPDTFPAHGETFDPSGAFANTPAQLLGDEATCGQIYNGENHGRFGSVCKRPKGHDSWHGTNEELLAATGDGFYWHDTKKQILPTPQSETAGTVELPKLDDPIRWALDKDGFAYHTQAEDGPWVLYADYVVLRTRLAEAEAQRIAAEQALAAMTAERDVYKSNVAGVEATLRSVRSQLAAEKAAHETTREQRNYFEREMQHWLGKENEACAELERLKGEMAK